MIQCQIVRNVSIKLDFCLYVAKIKQPLLDTCEYYQRGSHVPAGKDVNDYSSAL